MKTTILLLLAMSIATLSFSQEKKLIVNKLDGNSITYDLSQINSISFPEESLIIATKLGESDVYLLSDLDDMDVEVDILTDIFTSEGTTLGLTLSPNPTSSVLNLNIAIETTEDVVINVYDSQGNLVLKENKTAIIGNGFYTIDVSNLTSGIYYCQLQSGNNVYKQTFIKQ